MKVALYYPWIYLTSGAERTLLELSGRSRHEFTLFTNRYEPERTFPGLRSQRIVELDRISVKRSIGVTVRSALRIGMQKLPLSEYDALVVVSEGLGDFAVFRNHSVPILNICLTPLRIAFDPAYRARYRRDHGVFQAALVRLGAAGFAAAARRAWRHYSRVFCISRECLGRVQAGGLGRPGNQEILHVGAGFAPKDPGQDFLPYFLVPGRMMWTKNIELAIDAFQEFLRDNLKHGGFRLVIAGIVDDKSRPYLGRLQQLAGGDPRIRFQIFPTDEELGHLYRDCYGVLFTAFNEDWGIVPVEAMAFGKPVIAVGRGGPRESVVHGVTGFLEEPDKTAFAQRMSELANDEGLARRLGAAGRLRSQQYSWDSFVESIDQAIEELAERAPGRGRQVETMESLHGAGGGS